MLRNLDMLMGRRSLLVLMACGCAIPSSLNDSMEPGQRCVTTDLDGAPDRGLALKKGDLQRVNVGRRNGGFLGISTSSRATYHWLHGLSRPSKARSRVFDFPSLLLPRLVALRLQCCRFAGPSCR